MERYQTKDVSFVPPANWADRTVVAFATNPFPHGRKGGASIVVTRDAPPAGETLLAYAHRQLMQLRMGLSGFEVLGGLEYRVGGKPAMQLRVAWPTADGAVEQTIVHVAASSDLAGNLLRVVTFTSTLRDPGPMEAQLRDTFQTFLESISFGRDASASAPCFEPLPPIPAPGERVARR